MVTALITMATHSSLWPPYSSLRQMVDITQFRSRISLIPRFFPLCQRKIKTLTEGRGESLGTRLAQTACGTPTGEIGVVNCLFAPGTPNREDGCGQLPICTWYPQQRRWVWSTAYLHLVPPIEKMGVVNCLFHLCSIKCVLEQ